MHISKHAHKRLSIILTVVMIASLLLPVMASAATGGVSAVTLTASTTTPSVGGSVTLTANATASSSANVQYEFWFYDADGNWVCLSDCYSTSNTYTLTDIKAGMQIAAVYAKDGDNDPVMSNRVYLNVGTTSSVTTTYADGKITATATSTNIVNPRYDWWYKDPSGGWVSHYGHFTENSTMTLDNPAPGTYEIVCNVTDREFFWSLSENDGQWGSALFSHAAPPAVTTGLYVTSVSAINTTSTDPIATKVEAGATIKVDFNKAIDSTTANSTNFDLKKGTTTVATTVTTSADKKSVSIKPVTAMTVGSEYTLTIAAAVKVDGAAATLGTAVVNKFTIADTLALVSLKVGGTDVDTFETTGGALVLSFNKDISEATVNTGTIKLYNETDKVYVALNTAAIVATTTKVITVTPTADYVANKQYSVKINGLKALDGASLDGYTKTYGYATQVNIAPTLTLAPIGHTGLYNGIDSKMISYTAANGAAPAALVLASPIKAQIQFGRAMNAATLTADSFYIAEADVLGNEITGTKVAGTVTYDPASYTATFAPTAALKESQRYAAILTVSAKDAVGVPSIAQKVAFVTDDFTAPTVKSTSVDSGARVNYNEDIVIHFSEKMAAAQTVIVAAGPGEQAFTAGTSVRVYNQTANATIDGVTNAGLALDNTFIADATDPRLIIKAPTAGWALNNVYQVVLNGFTVGEVTWSLSDALIAGTKTHGNMLQGDNTTTFTTVAASKPTVTGVKAMKITDGAFATIPATALSMTDMTYNIQNAGTAGANNVMKITFSKNMAAPAAGAMEFWYDDGTGAGNPDDGIFDAAEKFAIDAAEFAVNTDKKIITWTPDAVGVATLTSLKAGSHEGRLVIKNTILDESGQALGTTASDDVYYKFTTGSGPAYAAPAGGGTVDPVKFATGFKVNETVEVVFDINIKYSTLNNVEIRKGSATGDLVAGTWYTDFAATLLPAANGLDFYFKPTAGLEANTKYYVIVPATVTSAIGNAAVPYNYYFTTEDIASPTATITMPLTYADPIVVTFDKTMNTTNANATDASNIAAYTITVNGTPTVLASVIWDATTDKKASIYLNAPVANGSVLQVTVKAGVLADNGVATTANIVSAEASVSNANAVAAYGIKEAKYDVTNRVLTITLDRPGALAAAADGSEIAITNGAYSNATNWVATSVSANGLTLTYVLKDTAPVSSLSIAPNISKVNIVLGKVIYTDSVGPQNYGVTPVTITN